MIRAMRKLKKILKRSGVKWKALFVYVDDFKTVLRAMKKGVKYCNKCQILHFSLEQFRIDNKSGETDEKRTARLVLEILN